MTLPPRRVSEVGEATELEAPPDRDGGSSSGPAGRRAFDEAMSASTLRTLDASTHDQVGHAETADEDTFEPPLANPSLAEAPGPTLDRRYVDEGVIGRGGMSVVHRMADATFARSVAMKLFRPGATITPDEALRFVEEARITGQLEHPNIVPVYDLDLGGDRAVPSFAMKLVQGETLARVIQNEARLPLNPQRLERLLDIFLRVCDAIAYAHTRGVVHRDLKPENVMVGPYGQVYVMDWGVARLLPAQGRSVEPLHGLRAPVDEAGAIVGTVIYMAPEQARGQSEQIDERTDVFGLGAILYAILTARPLYLAPTLLEAFQLARDCRVVPPEVAAPNRVPPPELCRIVAKACAERPEDRYTAVDALRADVADVVRGGGWFPTRVYEAGTAIVEEGTDGDEAFIVVAGRCGVFKQREVKRERVSELGPGDVFGEAAVFSARPRTATVEALTSVTVKVVTRAALDRELEGRGWLRSLFVSLAERFTAADAELGRYKGGPGV
jgi:serine/threonine-protein kinase